MEVKQLSKDIFYAQLKNVLDTTDIDFLGERYGGKVRDCYLRGKERILITTDRLSCFDAVVTTLPFKGEVLNALALYWFKKTADIVENHIISVPDPNVIVVKNVEILPVEVIVRGYLSGSAWRDYEAGNPVSGVQLPAGIRCWQKLSENIITPSTKAAQGDHDMPISEGEIVSSGLVDKKLWQEVRETALALFSFGQSEAAKQGLILADTKYEFGLLDGKLILADEIHTLDSSRFWLSDTYQECFENGVSPKMLDKEPVRQWLLTQGYKGNGTPPAFSDDYRVELAEHYVSSFEKITGEVFTAKVENVTERVLRNLAQYR